MVVLTLDESGSRKDIMNLFRLASAHEALVLDKKLQKMDLQLAEMAAQKLVLQSQLCKVGVTFCCFGFRIRYYGYCNFFEGTVLQY